LQKISIDRHHSGIVHTASSIKKKLPALKQKITKTTTALAKTLLLQILLATRKHDNLCKNHGLLDYQVM